MRTDSIDFVMKGFLIFVPSLSQDGLLQPDCEDDDRPFDEDKVVVLHLLLVNLLFLSAVLASRKFGSDKILFL